MLPYLPWYFLSFGGTTRSWHPWTSDRGLHSRRCWFASDRFAWFDTCYSRTGLKNKARKIILITKCTSVNNFFLLMLMYIWLIPFLLLFFLFALHEHELEYHLLHEHEQERLLVILFQQAWFVCLKQKKNTYYKLPLHNTSIDLH